MNTIDKKVSDTVKKAGRTLGSGSKVEYYENASDLFEKLVSKGVAKKRGNNLLSSSEKHSKSTVLFNS